jgi:hypothetical protein
MPWILHQELELPVISFFLSIATDHQNTANRVAKVLAVLEPAVISSGMSY